MSSRISAGITGMTGMISVPICVAKIDQSRGQKSTDCCSVPRQNAPGHSGIPGAAKQTTCLEQWRVRLPHPGRPVVPPLHSLAHSHRCRPTVVPHNTITPPQAAEITPESNSTAATLYLPPACSPSRSAQTFQRHTVEPPHPLPPPFPNFPTRRWDHPHPCSAPTSRAFVGLMVHAPPMQWAR
jgi:hypothetical protein